MVRLHGGLPELRLPKSETIGNFKLSWEFRGTRGMMYEVEVNTQTGERRATGRKKHILDD